MALAFQEWFVHEGPVFRGWECEGEGRLGCGGGGAGEGAKAQSPLAQEAHGDKTSNPVLAASMEKIYRFSLLSVLICSRVQQRANKIFSGQI